MAIRINRLGYLEVQLIDPFITVNTNKQLIGKAYIRKEFFRTQNLQKFQIVKPLFMIHERGNHNNGFTNLQLLQKLSCQKPCWDKAILCCE